MVEFDAKEACAMAMHFHDVPEVLYLKSGKLVMKRDAQEFTLHPGETFHSPAGRPHAAYFVDPGVCVCWWPGQDSDVLEIGVL